MTPRKPHCYVLKVRNAENIPDNLINQAEQNDLYISPANRLSGFVKMAYIETPKLAEEFKEICLEIFNGKYGNEISIEIEGWDDGCYQISKPTIKRMARDSEKITKTIIEWRTNRTTSR